MKTTRHFDTLRRRFERNARALQSNVHNSLAQLRQAKKNAYQMAADYDTMIKKMHANLQDWVKSEGFKGKNCIDQFLEKHFAAAILVGENWRDLVGAIHEGMTEKQYLAEGVTVFLSRTQRDHAASSTSKNPTKPAGRPADSALRGKWVDYANDLEKAVRELRTEVQRHKAKLARMESKFKRLHAIVDSATSAV